MNIIIALEELGYVNQTDFKVSWDDENQVVVIAEWNHNDNLPEPAALRAAWDGWWAANGPSLDSFKETAKTNIDNFAEAIRLKYVTPGSAQAMVYQEKGDEAADYVANGYPADLASYPFIQAEVNATGKTATQSADDILAQKSAWIMIGAATEEARLGGKTAVDAATDEAAVGAARDAAVAALEVI